MRFIFGLLASAGALGVAVWLVDGFEFDGTWWQFLIVAAILGVANAIVKPILKFFSIPFIVVTLGLFLFITNAFTLQIVVWLSELFDLGLTSTGFFWATFWASIVVSIVSWLINVILPDPD